MKLNHNFFSNLAFNIAEYNLGKTKKNPSVGCVVVKNNSVISSGITSVNGRPHAEFNALKRKIDFRNSTLYVTLEPCTHYGITPPCTNIIKKKKIKKVFYCFDDFDLRTKQKAKKELIKNNINTKKLNFKNNNFYKSYFLNRKNGLPLIDAKIAISKDNFTINKKSKWISNYRSRKVAHLIRSKYDCILSTSKSINKDNSLLNCRIEGFNYFKPELIIIDNHLSLKTDLKLISLAKKRKTYIFTASNNKKKINFFKRKNIKVLKFDELLTKKDFNFFFKKIYSLGKTRILVESGLTFLNKLLYYNLLNNLYIFKSNLNLKKKGSNNAKIDFIKNLKPNEKINVNLQNDKLFKVRIK